jgi:hypothetical protein
MKGRLFVKKILAISLCLGLVCAMSVSLVGCDGKDKDKKKDKTGAPAAGETVVKFKAIDDQKVKSKGDVTVSVELTEKATADIVLTAKVKDNDKITGTGKIAKDSTKGDIKLESKEAKAGDVVVDVTAAADKVKGDTTFKLKVE